MNSLFTFYFGVLITIVIAINFHAIIGLIAHRDALSIDVLIINDLEAQDLSLITIIY